MKARYIYTVFLFFTAGLLSFAGPREYSASEAIWELRRQYPEFKPDAAEIARSMFEAKLLRLSYHNGHITIIPKGAGSPSLIHRMEDLFRKYNLDHAVSSHGCVTFVSRIDPYMAGHDLNVGFMFFSGEAGPEDGVCVDNLAIQPVDGKHLRLYEKLDRGLYIYRLLSEAGDFSISNEAIEAMELCPSPVPTQNPPELEPALPSPTPVQQQNGKEKKDASK
jgi:hypothetical protein